MKDQIEAYLTYTLFKKNILKIVIKLIKQQFCLLSC